MTADLLLRTIIAGYAIGALGSVVARGRASRGFAAFGGAIGSAATLGLGFAGVIGRATAGLAIPGFALTPLAFRVDALGAFFLIVVGAVGLPAAIYGFSYSAAYRGLPLRIVGASVNLLLLTLSLQVLADNPLTFLFVWELMSLAAAVLVLSDASDRAAVSAANWYLGVTHAGFAALIAMFLLLSGGQLATPFTALHAAPLSNAARDGVFLLALVGFGSKAGIIPLHVWLPRAHPVAPSHASALMSGVVLKMGVYGLIRVVFDLLGGGPAWWGVVVLALGTVSALLGVLYALMQHDLKRLLAYHSIENVGIIFMGIGTALLVGRAGLPLVAALALVAALYHTLNHACFKGLLFFGAGAVAHATGTRNIEEMGGLISRMPRTAFAFLIGSAAISALPPLNGFASEWLLFQSLLGGARVPSPTLALMMPLAVGLLALTSGLAAACFVKAFGVTFLAIPRSARAERAHEAPMTMQVAMLALVGACVALGVGMFAAVPAIARVVAQLPGLDAGAALRASGPFLIGLPAGTGQMSTLIFAAVLVALAVAVPAALRLLTPALRLRRSDTWGCGRLVQTPRMQYTATAFAEPLKRIFAELYRPTEDLVVDRHPESKYFVRGISYESHVRSVVEHLIYEPFVSVVERTSTAARTLQSGSVHLYLAYVCGALVALLVAARWLR